MADRRHTQYLRTQGWQGNPKSELSGFGRVLADLREQRGFSQPVLAELADCDHSYLSRLEHGHRRPTPEMVERLALALQLDEDRRIWLFVRAGLLPPELTEIELDRVAVALGMLRKHQTQESYEVIERPTVWGLPPLQWDGEEPAVVRKIQRPWTPEPPEPKTPIHEAARKIRQELPKPQRPVLVALERMQE